MMKTKVIPTAIAVVAAAAGVGLLTLKRMRLHSFRNAVVVITGGSRGLGLELARRWGSEGARIAICSRSEEELRRAQTELAASGIQAMAASCDVTDESQVRAFIAQVRSRLGEVDVLVNNAGVIQVGPVECMTRDDFRQAMDIHYWGALNTIEAVVDGMRRRRRGRIVNIASIGGKISVPHLVPYCGSKFALVGLSEGLHAELAQYGIQVTTVCPGLMRTGSPRNAQFKGKHRLEYAWFSVSGALPGLSVSSQRAAWRIVEGCRRGASTVTISPAAIVAVRLSGLLPRVSSTLLRLSNRLLPGAGGIGSRSVHGHESASRWSPSLLTLLDQRAAARNNEI